MKKSIKVIMEDIYKPIIDALTEYAEEGEYVLVLEIAKHGEPGIHKMIYQITV